MSTSRDNKGEELSTCDILKEEVGELKWRVLIVACFLTFGSYYIYDFPGSIGTGRHATIQAWFAHNHKEYTQEMNQALYSVYSWPNTVLAMFGGLLIDKFLGLRRAMLLFTSLVFAGSCLFYVGVITVQYPVMLCARVLFGLGGESLSVAQSAFVARWFKGGRGLALAFGITISFSRVGSSFNFLFSPMIATDVNIQTAVMCGMIACCISLLSCFVLIACDIYAVKKNYIKAEAHEDDSTVMRFSDIKHLPKEFWVICVICVFCYCSIFPFIGIGKNFFEQKFGYTGDDASRFLSVYQFSSAGFSPVIGAIVDNVGRNTLWLIAASVMFILVHLILLLTMIPGAVVMGFMGGFYSFLVSGLWPSVPWVVRENVVGFSYGVMTAAQNTGLAIFPLITGAILDAYTPAQNTTNRTHHNATVNETHIRMLLGVNNLETNTTTDSSSSSASGGPLPELTGFKLTEIVFMGSATVSLIASVVLLIMDLRGPGVLTAPAAERKAREAEREALTAGKGKEEKDPLLNADTSTTRSMKTQEAFA